MATLTLRVFVSSPGDVDEERQRARDVLERLQGEFHNYVTLAPYFWEHEPMRATETFQRQIPPPSATDIVVCILWSRIGTRLPQDIKRPDGTTYASGTAYELEDAVQSYEARGTPDLLVYRKTAIRYVPYAEDEEEYRVQREQRQALEQLIDRWFRHPDGSFKAGFNSFASPEEFEKQLERHLRQLIRDQLAKQASEPDGREMKWFQGSPYRGLQAFEVEHAPVFYGRERAISALQQALQAQAARGCAFVLIFGMSGCGKSSLVRAGVLPRLIRPGVIQEVGLWRWCIFRPSDATVDLFDGLALALLQQHALPELGAGLDASRLATALRESPQAADVLIRQALHRVSEALASEKNLEQPRQARLLVIVDQLEELFTLGRVDETQRKDFIAVLSTLARSGVVWVVATMRSDFYPRCADLPELVALKEGAGQYDLLPPEFWEIGQMIRQPAQDAGLAFEKDLKTNQYLDDVLHEEAARDPAALPLLEFTLDELFKRRTDQQVLTFAAYQSLGGLEGALARRAEDEFTRLPQPVQAAFPSVMRSLVTVSHSGQNVVVARPMPRASLASTAEREALLDALIQARLLVSDRDRADNQPVVRVAHEALLVHWPRLKDLLDSDYDFLQTRARVADAAARWQQEGRATDFLLPEGKPIVEAQDMLAKRREDLDPELVEYVAASSQRLARQRRRRTGIVAAVFAVILGLGAFSTVQCRRALWNELTARQELYVMDIKAAKQSWDRGQILEASAFLERQMPQPGQTDVRDFAWSYLSWLVRSGGARTLGEHTDMINSVVFAPNGKTVASASADGTLKLWELTTGREVWTQRVTFTETGVGIRVHKGEGALVVDEVFKGGPAAQDGRLTSGARIVGISNQQGEVVNIASVPLQAALYLLRGEPDTPVHLDVIPLGEQQPNRITLTCRKYQTSVPIVQAVFHPDGKWIASAGKTDGIVRVWHPVDGRQLYAFWAHPAIKSMTLAPDGEVLATAGEEGTVKLWNIRAGPPAELAKTWDGENVNALAFSPDGKTLALGRVDGRLRLRDVAVGQVKTETEMALQHILLTEAIQSMAFAPDGQTIGVGLESGAIKVVDVSTQKVRHNLEGPAGLVKEEKASPWTTASVAFSPNGQSLATAGADNTVKLWSLETGQLQASLRGQARAVRSIAFSPDGKALAAGGLARNVVVWDDVSRKQESDVLDRVVKGPNGLAFSPDSRSLFLGSGVTAVPGTLDPEPGEIRLYDMAAGQWRWLQKPADAITFIQFSSDGKSLAAGSSGGIVARSGVVRIYDTATGQIRTTIAGFLSDVSGAFSPDGKTLAIAGADVLSSSRAGAVTLWDAATGRKLVTLEGQTDAVESVSFSPDGKTLAAGGVHPLPAELGEVKLWDVTTGELRTTLKGPGQIVAALAFSPDGQTLAAGGGRFRHPEEPGIVKLWNTATWAEVATIVNTGGVFTVAFSPNSKTLVLGGWESAGLWDVASGQLHSTRLEHSVAADSLAFSPDGSLLAAGTFGRFGHSGALELLDLRSRAERVRFKTAPAQVMAVAFSPDGKTLAMGSLQGRLTLLDAATGKELALLPGQDLAGDAHTHAVTSVAVSPDGKLLATGSEDKSIKLWDLATDTVRATLTGHTAPVLFAAFSDDGRSLATASWNPLKLRTFDASGEVMLWDVTTGQLLRTLPQETAGIIRGIALAPDGKTLAYGTPAGELKLWDITRGKLLATLKPPVGIALVCVAFAPDGKILAGGSFTGDLILWDLVTRHMTAPPKPAHVGPIVSVVFSPDGKTLATGGADGLVKLWHVATGEELISLQHNFYAIFYLMFSPDGKTLAATGSKTDGSSVNPVGGSVQLWPVVMEQIGKNEREKQ